MHAELNDKVVLITGVSGGIGGATARALAGEGARLILHYHSHDEAARRLADEIGPRAFAAQADLRDEGQTDALFAQAVARFGRIDVVVANAGFWRSDAIPLQHLTLAQWRETIDADLTSVFLTCRAFLQHLERQPRERAAIVLVGSTSGLFGEAGHADYSAAKSAVQEGLLKSLKNEIVRLAPRGRVNAVAPGWTDTPMAARHTADPAAVDRATLTMPLRKLARSADIAAAIVFLASDALAGHISGALLPVAGGMEGRLLHGAD